MAARPGINAFQHLAGFLTFQTGVRLFPEVNKNGIHAVYSNATGYAGAIKCAENYSSKQNKK
jgi:hypothetical protein